MKSLYIYLLRYLMLYSTYIVHILLLSAILFFAILIIRYFIIPHFQFSVKHMLASFILSFSLAIIFVMTLYDRKIDLKNTKLTLAVFTSYGQVFQDRNPEVLLQIIMNIILFIPFGISLPCNFKWFEKKKRILGVAFLLSGAIEFIQGITGMGFFELDDIFNNVVGAAIGAMIYIGIKKWKYKLCNRK